VADYDEQGHEPSGSVKGREIFGYLCRNWLLKASLSRGVRRLDVIHCT